MADNPAPHAYQDMPLWQRSVELAAEISQFAAGLPGAASVTAVSNLQEAAIHIPVLLARGSKASKAGFREACLAGRAACLEVETLLQITGRIYNDAPMGSLLERTDELYNGLTIMAKRMGESAKPSV